MLRLPCVYVLFLSQTSLKDINSIGSNVTLSVISLIELLIREKTEI